MLKQLKIYQQKNKKKETYKVKPKWIKDLNVRATTIKLLEENKVEKLHDVGFGSEFFDMTPKAETANE